MTIFIVTADYTLNPDRGSTCFTDIIGAFRNRQDAETRASHIVKEGRYGKTRYTIRKVELE
jgi:hypothetical protein